MKRSDRLPSNIRDFDEDRVVPVLPVLLKVPGKHLSSERKLDRGGIRENVVQNAIIEQSVGNVEVIVLLIVIGVLAEREEVNHAGYG